MSVAAITCLFGAGGGRRLANYHRFAADLVGMGLDLWTIEAAFPGQEFSLEPGPRVLQASLGPRQILWQKERLLNLVAAQLPAAVDGIAWIDADVLFDCGGLPDLIELALGRCPVVQLWQYAVLLGPDGQREAWPNGVTCAEGLAAGNYGRWPKDTDPRRWHPGFAWAMRRETWQAMGGLYEHALGGCGDGIMAAAWLGAGEANPYLRMLSPAARRHAVDWGRKAEAVVRCDLGYLPIAIGHLWHGRIADRRYFARTKYLGRHGFDPGRHVAGEIGQPLRWTDQAPIKLVSWWDGYLRRAAS